LEDAQQRAVVRVQERDRPSRGAGGHRQLTERDVGGQPVGFHRIRASWIARVAVVEAEPVVGDAGGAAEQEDDGGAQPAARSSGVSAGPMFHSDFHLVTSRPAWCPARA
jgi:hypothetical protein